jgi:hypothetical protein
MHDEATVDPFQRFKWDVLHDAVFEDWQGLWEPVWWLRGGGAIEGQSEAERQEFAERALRELHDEGLIFFFRVPAGADINASAEGEHARLNPEELYSMIAENWWRGTGGLPDSHPNIWWGPTPAGEAAANDPPQQIRAVWELAAVAISGWRSETISDRLREPVIGHSPAALDVAVAISSAGCERPVAASENQGSPLSSGKDAVRTGVPWPPKTPSSS